MWFRKLFPAVVCLATAAAGVAIAQTSSRSQEPRGGIVSVFAGDGGFLGIHTVDITKDNLSRFGLREPRGVGVDSVIENSPAARAGLRKDDVILKYDGEPVASARKLTRLVTETAPDHTVRLTISRGGAEQEISVTIGRRESSDDVIRTWEWREFPEPERFEDFKRRLEELNKRLEDRFDSGALIQRLGYGQSRRIGVSTMELNKQLAEYFGVAGGRGVLVTEVHENGPAAKAGIKAGDVITAADGNAVGSASDLLRELGRKETGEVSLTIIRKGAAQTIKVTPEKRSEYLFGPGGIRIYSDIGRIRTPRIGLSVPRVSVQLPRIRVEPKMRIKPALRPVIKVTPRGRVI